MIHDEYWKKVMSHSEKTLCGLFDGSRTRIDATDAARFFDNL